jgi:hypothetical protein
MISRQSCVFKPEVLTQGMFVCAYTVPQQFALYRSLYVEAYSVHVCFNPSAIPESLQIVERNMRSTVHARTHSHTNTFQR